MRAKGLRSQTGYCRHAGCYGKPAVVTQNHLKQKFAVAAPNRVWVTDNRSTR